MSKLKQMSLQVNKYNIHKGLYSLDEFSKSFVINQKKNVQSPCQSKYYCCEFLEAQEILFSDIKI